MRKLLLLAIVCACSESKTSDEMRGVEGWPCYADGTCDPGFLCIEAICRLANEGEPDAEVDAANTQAPILGAPTPSGCSIGFSPSYSRWYYGTNAQQNNTLTAYDAVYSQPAVTCQQDGVQLEWDISPAYTCNAEVFPRKITAYRPNGTTLLVGSVRSTDQDEPIIIAVPAAARSKTGHSA